MGKVSGGGGGSGGATAAKKKKKGRPSLLDLQKRALDEQNSQSHQRRSSRRNPSSASADADDYYDDDDDERKEKKVKLVVRLPQSDHQLHFSSDFIRSSSVNSASCGSDSNADADNRKPKSRSAALVADHQGEKVLKAMDILHGSPLESGPTTPLPDRKLLVFILDRLQKKDTHAVFSEPVDPNELPDYHEIIKQPMDFGTVRSKLDGGLYSNLEELESDVYLICSNAMQYNSSDTIYFRQARSIQELAKRDFENLRLEGENGELQPKVVKRGRPPGKQVKKTPGRPPLDRVGPESTSGATLATTEDNTNESTPYNLRKAPPMLYRFQADGLLGSQRSRNGEHYSELMSDWNEEFPERIRKADMKYGNKNLVIDETRRDTYKQFHPSTYANESSLSNFGGERKQLLAVGLHAEHGYARSLARFAANLGPVVWKIASKKIEKALPPGTKFAPGVVGENDLPPPSSFIPPGNPRPIPGLVTDIFPNRPQTPSTSGQNPSTLNHPKVEATEPDTGVRTGSSSHHVRNGFNSGFGSTTAVEHEKVGQLDGGPAKPTWQQVPSSNHSPSPFTAAVQPDPNPNDSNGDDI